MTEVVSSWFVTFFRMNVTNHVYFCRLPCVAKWPKSRVRGVSQEPPPPSGGGESRGPLGRGLSYNITQASPDYNVISGISAGHVWPGPGGLAQRSTWAGPRSHSRRPLMSPMTRLGPCPAGIPQLGLCLGTPSWNLLAVTMISVGVCVSYPNWNPICTRVGPCLELRQERSSARLGPIRIIGWADRRIHSFFYQICPGDVYATLKKCLIGPCEVVTRWLVFYRVRHKSCNKEKQQSSEHLKLYCILAIPEVKIHLLPLISSRITQCDSPPRRPHPPDGGRVRPRRYARFWIPWYLGLDALHQVFSAAGSRTTTPRLVINIAL